jgi:hypothetical protein
MWWYTSVILALRSLGRKIVGLSHPGLHSEMLSQKMKEEGKGGREGGKKGGRKKVGKQ